MLVDYVKTLFKGCSRKILAVGFIWAMSHAAFSVDPSLNWKTVETPHFRIHFSEQNSDIAAHSIKILEKVHPKITQQLQWEPRDKTEVVLDDGFDSPNGFARSFPYNMMHLRVVPPVSGSLIDSGEWLELLITHEYTHIIHLDKTSGAPGFLRHIFGRYVLLFPNLFQPTWLIEGLATHEETDHYHGVGRGGSPYFSMKMRSEVMGGFKSIREVNVPARDWPFDTAYLYGVHFYQFLEDTYGKEALFRFINNYSNNLIPYWVDLNPRPVYGKSLTELWNEFELYATKRYQKQLDELKVHPEVRGKLMTRNGQQKASLMVDSSGKILSNMSVPYQEPALIQLTSDSSHRNQSFKELKKIHSAVGSLSSHPESGLLLSQPDLCENKQDFFDLYRYNRGKLQRITHCQRYRRAQWMPSGREIIALKTVSGRTRLDVLGLDGTFKKTLWKGQYGELVGHYVVHPTESKIFASVKRGKGQWNIESFDWSKNVWKSIVNAPSNQIDPVLSQNGRSIAYSSDESGVYNIYQKSLDDHSVSLSPVPITNVMTGAFSPAFGPDQSLYYLYYSDRGFDIARISTPKAVNVASLHRDHAPDYDGDHGEGNHHANSLQLDGGLKGDPLFFSKAEDYSPWKTLVPRYWFPVFTVNDTSSQYGAFTSGSDVLGLHGYGLQLTVEPDLEEVFGYFSYSYNNRFNAFLSRSLSYTELDEAHTLFEISSELQLVVNKPWIQYDQQHQLSLGFIYDDQDGFIQHELNDRQKVGNILNLIVGASWQYNNSKQYLQSISRVDGRQVRVVTEHYIDDEDTRYSGEVYSLDWREYFRLGRRAVFATRWVGAWGTDQPEPFTLGGLGSESYSALQSQFNIRDYGLRGYSDGLAQLRGSRMQLINTELRIPLMKHDWSWTLIPFGLQQSSIHFFTDSGAVWDKGESANRFKTGVGMEWVVDMTLFYNVVFKSRLGAATGLDDELGENQLYWQLGTSF